MELIVTHTVVLNLSEKPPDLLAQSQTIATKLTNNTDVPNPAPTVGAINALNAALSTAIANARSKATGTVTLRSAAVKAVKDALTLVKASVQAAVNLAPDRALVIAEGAGMTIKTTSTRVKADFEVSQPKGHVSGTATAARKAIKGSTSSEWGTSVDGGKTFVSAPSTIACSTPLAGLPVGTAVIVRHRFLTRKGYTDWVQTAPFTVR